MIKMTVRVGVIGTGKMGSLHARVYSEMDNVKLAGVCDTNKENAEKVAEKYNAKPYTDYNEMIEKEKLDIVNICTPTKTHYLIAKNILQKKVAVLIEKPICSTVEEADDLIKIARQNNCVVTVGHVERFNPAVQYAKKMIDENKIGKIITIGAKRVGPTPPISTDINVTFDLAIHDMDIIRFLTGNDAKEIYSQKADTKTHNGLVNNVFIIIKMKNGSVGTIETNWITHRKVRKLSITGENGTLDLDYITQDIEIQHITGEYKPAENQFNAYLNQYTEGIIEKPMIIKKEPLRAELEHFVDCVKSKKQPQVSLEDGKKALELILKAEESLKTGKPIEC